MLGVLLAASHRQSISRLENKIFLTTGGSEDDYVTAIYYDEKGRREKIYYGNCTHTSYTYDPLSYQLNRLKTQKNTDIFQDLNYWYDPVGNITTVKDDA